MATAPYTYDPRQVALIVGGHQVTGLADGTFLEWTPEGQDWEDISGADGHVARSKTNDRRGTLTLTLAQTSPSNEILSALLTADRADGRGVVPVLVKERGANAPTLLSSAGAWIMQPPDVTYNKEVGEREWQLRGAWDVFVGGGRFSEGRSINSITED